VGVAAALSVVLSACSVDAEDAYRATGLPEPASDRAPAIGDLWVGTWIAAMVIGVIVWGLILFAAVAYRRRKQVLPEQTRYNIPIETFYTLVPLLIVGVLFFWTMQNTDEVLANDAEPDVTIGVVGQQWSWTFNHLDADVYEVGTAADAPTLVLPVDNVVEFQLESPDVIHSFWVPAFYFKMDVIPGVTNRFQMTPNRIGTFAGKCTELCGAYHSRMLFNVEVVSEAEYEAHLLELEARGQTGTIEAPLRGAYSTDSLSPLEVNP
jgi:cytochrome c oxidase subunit 2